MRECALPYGGVCIQSFDTARNNVANFFFIPSFLIDFFHEDEPTFFSLFSLDDAAAKMACAPATSDVVVFFSSGCTFYFILFFFFSF